MTPGWINVRNQLAETHDERPRGLANLNWPVAILLAITSIAAWCVLMAAL